MISRTLSCLSPYLLKSCAFGQQFRICCRDCSSSLKRSQLLFFFLPHRWRFLLVGSESRAAFRANFIVSCGSRPRLSDHREAIFTSNCPDIFPCLGRLCRWLANVSCSSCSTTFFAAKATYLPDLIHPNLLNHHCWLKLFPLSCSLLLQVFLCDVTNTRVL